MVAGNAEYSPFPAADADGLPPPTLSKVSVPASNEPKRIERKAESNLYFKLLPLDEANGPAE
jgi:hypothetical protein